ncbi:UNVERIFIED_CONTAM: hypothetical protein RMT77_004579 [Armadillidium vulgare]
MTIDEDFDIPGTGAIFTFGKCRFAENTPAKFWIKNDIILKVACGDEHTTIVTGSGRVFVIGNNSNGQLGLGSRKSVSKPSCIKALKPQRVIQIACGRAHTLAATDIGSVFAWGNNGDGQLGVGNFEDKNSPVEILKLPKPPLQLAAGSAHSMLLTDNGQIYAWGSNKEGQLGFLNGSKLLPSKLELNFKISSISCGYYHSLAITDDGLLLSWGESQHGKLGYSSSDIQEHGPKIIDVQEKVVMCAAGSNHSLLLTETGKVMSCGLGLSGQLGLGNAIEQTTCFKHVTKDSLKFIFVTAGDTHSAAISSDAMVYTWGCGRHGKLCLGEQDFSPRFSPVIVNRLRHLNAVQVSCGGCHTMVLGYRRSELGPLARRLSSGSLFLKETRGLSEKMVNQLREMKSRPTAVKEISLPTPINEDSSIKCEEKEKCEETYDENLPDESSSPLQDSYFASKEEKEKFNEIEEDSMVLRESKRKASRFASFWKSIIKSDGKRVSYSATDFDAETKNVNPKVEDFESVSEKHIENEGDIPGKAESNGLENVTKIAFESDAEEIGKGEEKDEEAESEATSPNEMKEIKTQQNFEASPRKVETTKIKSKLCIII